MLPIHCVLGIFLLLLPAGFVWKIGSLEPNALFMAISVHLTHYEYLISHTQCYCFAPQSCQCLHKWQDLLDPADVADCALSTGRCVLVSAKSLLVYGQFYSFFTLAHDYMQCNV